MRSPTSRALSRRLALRLTLVLGCLLSVIVVGVAALAIHLGRQSHVEAAVAETERFADTIKRSAEYAMLHAQQDSVREIVNAVGRQRDVRWVRILNKEGRVTYSTRPGEIGTVLDKRTEACYRCHQAEAPLERLDSPDRSRILSTDDRRVLATIDPIYNQPSCSSAACHFHPSSQRVLGVLDVAISLDERDRLLQGTTYTLVAGALLAVAAVCGLVAFSLHRGVERPVRSLLRGTRRVAEGDFAHRIAAEGQDEIAELASSFNEMTASLQKSRDELTLLAGSLEQRIEEKTRELRDANEHVLRAEKLASLGRMAAGVAHEMNNPLTGILTFAHLLLRKAQEGSQDRKDLEVIVGETNRCARIVKEMLTFARDTPPDKRAGDLNRVVRETVAFLQPQPAFKPITFQMDLDEALPETVFDAAQARQVLVNLLQNAAEAMASGGMITVATRTLPAAVELSVADTGSGIPRENLGRIFDPFFTTKDPGQGTGLGLAVTMRLVENHGGTIRVESEVGRGSTFRVTLPR